MAGLRPTEGDIMCGKIILQTSNVLTFQANCDRAATLTLALYSSNTTPNNTDTLATYTKVTGNGYADKILTDASWADGGAGLFTYAAQTFTAAGGSWTVYGYIIHSVKAGTGTNKLLAAERDPNAPITVNNGSDYIITPQITFS